MVKKILIISTVLACVEGSESWGRGLEDVLDALNRFSVNSTCSQASADKGYSKQSVFITYTYHDSKHHLVIPGDTTVFQLRRALADTLRIAYNFDVTDASGSVIDPLRIESGDTKIGALGKLLGLFIK